VIVGLGHGGHAATRTFPTGLRFAALHVALTEAEAVATNAKISIATTREARVARILAGCGGLTGGFG
jgi:hypothetical protein